MRSEGEKGACLIALEFARGNLRNGGLAPGQPLKDVALDGTKNASASVWIGVGLEFSSQQEIALTRPQSKMQALCPWDHTLRPTEGCHKIWGLEEGETIKMLLKKSLKVS